MARVTVEDCLDHVENRFQLVLVASKRARQLNSGVHPLVERENDKATVMALREIAEGRVTAEILNQEAQPPEPEVEPEVVDETADATESGIGAAASGEKEADEEV